MWSGRRLKSGRWSSKERALGLSFRLTASRRTRALASTSGLAHAVLLSGTEIRAQDAVKETNLRGRGRRLLGY